jgi:hypothetical protein
MENHPGKTVLPQGWYGMPMADLLGKLVEDYLTQKGKGGRGVAGIGRFPG